MQRGTSRVVGGSEGQGKIEKEKPSPVPPWEGHWNTDGGSMCDNVNLVKFVFVKFVKFVNMNFVEFVKRE